MIKYIFKRLFYGFLVLLGVITLVFFLFSIAPGDPARNVAGNHSNEETIASIRKDFGLDVSLGKRYCLYINDLSPISMHNKSVPNSRIFLDSTKYNYTELFSWSENRTMVFKYPYLRRAYKNGRNVSDIISSSLPNTMILALVSIIIATILGIAMGVTAALNKGSFFDTGSIVMGVLGMSMPSYLTAILLSWLGGTIWYETTSLPMLPFFILLLGLCYGVITQKKHGLAIGSTKKIQGMYIFEWIVKGFGIGILVWILGVIVNSFVGSNIIPGVTSYITLPGTGLDSVGAFSEENDWTGVYEYHWDRLILPAITLGIRPLAIIMQLTRSSMLDVMSKDYIRTAKAKGLSNTKVIFKHTLKNALNPVITAVSGWFASLLAGAVFVEWVFGFGGIGSALVQAVQENDLPVAMGITVLVAIFFVVINILVDVAYGFLDPRVRIK